MKNITDSTFSRNNYSRFIILIVIFTKNFRRPNIEGVLSIFCSVFPIATTSTHFRNIDYFAKRDTIRAEVFYQLFQFTHLPYLFCGLSVLQLYQSPIQDFSSHALGKFQILSWLSLWLVCEILFLSLVKALASQK